MGMRRTRSVLCLLLSVAGGRALCGQSQGALETTSLLGTKLYAQAEDASVAAARAKVAGGGGSAGESLELSKAEAGRREYREAIQTDTEALGRFPNNADLLLERGHRELGLREFRAAQRDLEEAARVQPGMLDAHYHLGLAYYFQGQFAEAAKHFGQARELGKSDDSLIDCTNWLYASLRRAGREKEAAQALTRITPAVHNTEPHLEFYLKLLRFYQGQMTEAQIVAGKPQAGDTEAELSYNTISYGVGNWHLYHGEKAAAKAFFKRVVGGQAWNSWGFVGSEVELARR